MYAIIINHNHNHKKTKKKLPEKMGMDRVQAVHAKREAKESVSIKCCGFGFWFVVGELTQWVGPSRVVVVLDMDLLWVS